MGKKKYIPSAHLDILTPFYDLGCGLIGLGKRFRLKIIGHMNITGTERALDVGCGTGALLIVLKGLYPDVISEGLDPDEQALRIARRKSVNEGLEITWRTGRMQNMPFDENSFDIVISTLAFHHVGKLEKIEAMKECLRILRPGGRFLLLDIAPDELALSGRTLFKILRIFEPICSDQQLLAFMKEAGFSGTRELGKFRYGITFIEGRKLI